MAKYNSTQPSFSSGIISTELFSRIDYSKLNSGLKQCENWFIRPAGGAEYRTGTKYVATTKNSTDDVCLIPFNQSRDISYCLEFGNNYIRVYKEGNQVQSGGSPVEIATTYTTNELKEIKYAQNKNTMYIVHKNHCPAVLTRTSDTAWTLTDMVFNPTVPVIQAVGITAQTPKSSESVVAFDKWQYAVSVYTKDENEGMAAKSNVISSDIDISNQNILITFSAPSGMQDGDYFYVYRILRGEFYFVYKIKYVSGTSNYSLKDVGFATDTTKSIKKSFKSFNNNNYPSAVGLWNQRLLFANTPKEPNTIYGSCIGVYDDFTTTNLNNSDEAFELTLNSGTTDVITDLVPMDDLIVMTQSKLWRVIGTTPSTMSAYIESYSGASGLRPFACKKSILYVDSSKNTISNFIYSYELNGYVGQNLDILCRDLFDGHTITDVSFRDAPFSVLYVVRNDGVLLGMTYLKEENIYAWHKHTTNGSFKCVCCVDKPSNDDVYVVVERNGTKYIELFQRQINVEETVKDSWHLDCATKFMSNINKWKNTVEIPTKTYHTFTTTGERIVGTTVCCWKATYRRSGAYPIRKYFYNFNPSGYDVNNMLANSNCTITTDFSTLSPASMKEGHLTMQVSRSSSNDFTKYDTYRTNYRLVYTENLTAGSPVYDLVGEDFIQIGTITSYENNQMIFNEFTYTQGSDYVIEGGSETNFAYTVGYPSVGDTAYRDAYASVTLGTISATDETTITVSSIVYTLYEEGTDVTDTISGLERFNGRLVTVVADGNEYANLNVISGQVKLDKSYSNMIVGLPYTGKLEPIPVDVKFQNTGTTVGLNRRITKATIRYYRSRGLWYGMDESKMFEIKPYTQTTFGEEIDLETNVLNVEVTDSYKTETSFIIEQRTPFPALIQSITLEINYGEKN